MPRKVTRKIGEIHQSYTERTAWDKFLDVLKEIGAFMVVMLLVVLLVAIFG